MTHAVVCEDEYGKTRRLRFTPPAGKSPEAYGQLLFKETYEGFLRMTPPARRRAHIVMPRFIRVEAIGEG